MQPIAQHFNHLAIIVCGVILWVLGAIWYSPALFAKPWMEILGISKGSSKRGTMVLGMISSFICDLVIAFMLAHLIIWSAAPSFGWGVFIGCLVWVGFYGSINLPQNIYEGRPFKLFAINGGYWLLGLGLIGGILAVWK